MALVPPHTHPRHEHSQYLTLADAAAAGLFLPLSGGTLTGPLTVPGVTSDADPINAMRHAKIGRYNGGISVTGIFLIELPVGLMGSMANFRVHGYNYLSGDGGFDLHIGGYMYAGNPSAYWVNHSVDAIGFDRAPSQTVRLLAKGGTGAGDQRYAIAIGDAGTVWTYPQIHVEVDAGGYVVGGASALASPATITAVTDISSWTSVVSPTVNLVTTKGYVDTGLAGKSDSSHTHSYLPLAGGTVTGSAIFSAATTEMRQIYLHHPGVDHVKLESGTQSGAYCLTVINPSSGALAPIRVGSPINGESAARVDWVQGDRAAASHSHSRTAAGYGAWSVDVGSLAAGTSYGPWSVGHAWPGSPSIIISDAVFDDGVHSVDTSIGTWDTVNTGVTAKNNHTAAESCVIVGISVI